MPGDKYNYKGRKKAPRKAADRPHDPSKKPKIYGVRYGTLNQLGAWHMYDSEAGMKKAGTKILQDHQKGFALYFERDAMERIQKQIDAINTMVSLTLDDNELTPRRYETLLDSERNIWCAIEFKKIKPSPEQQLTIIK